MSGSQCDGEKPKVALEIRQPIRNMSAANPTLGAPRIHREQAGPKRTWAPKANYCRRSHTRDGILVFRGSDASSWRRASGRGYAIPLIRGPVFQLGKFGFGPLDHDLRPAA